MNTLYILCGCPGVGKTTYAHKYLYNSANKYVSRDEIRFSLVAEDEDYFSKEPEVFKKFIRLISDYLYNYDVIADATHITKGSRKKLLNALTATGVSFDIIYITFPASLECCLARNQQRSGRSKVPDANLVEMYHKINWPTLLEDPRIKGIWTIKGEF